MNCEDRSGFLFAHACDRPAVGPCVRCGKNICEEHTRVTEAGNTCIACVRQERSGLRSDATRDDPYFWSDDDYADQWYYDAEDYRAFDPRAGAPGKEPEEDAAGS